MGKIGVIINPHGKIIRKNKKHLESYEKMDKEFVDVKITNTLDGIDDVIKGFKKDNVSYIAVVGGDGTLHNVLTRVINIYSNGKTPGILILKGGTMNNVARSLRLKGTGPKMLNRFVSVIKEGKEVEIIERDTMKIRGCYCFLFGTGLVTNFLKEVYKYEKGWAANFKVIYKAIKQALFEREKADLFKGLKAKIYLDNKLLDFDYFNVILGGTVESIGNGIKTMARAHEEKYKFNMLLCGFSPVKIVMKLHKLLRGKIVEHPKMRNLLLTSMKIESENGFDFTMDGEMFHTDKDLDIEIGERLKFVHV